MLILAAGVLATAVSSAPRGLGVELDAGEVPIAQALLVKVGRDGRVLVDCEPTELGAIRSRLSREPGTPVILYTDPTARYESMIAVHDRLASLGNPLHVPTRGDVRTAIARHGRNPYETRCVGSPVAAGAAAWQTDSRSEP
jgi:hypothetical protein